MSRADRYKHKNMYKQQHILPLTEYTVTVGN